MAKAKSGTKKKKSASSKVKTKNAAWKYTKPAARRGQPVVSHKKAGTGAKGIKSGTRRPGSVKKDAKGERKGGSGADSGA